MFRRNIVLLALCVLAAADAQEIPALHIQRVTSCSIAITGGLPEPQPLLIVPGTNQFLEPKSSSGYIDMQFGDLVELFCSDSFEIPFNNTNTVFAMCHNNNQFQVNDRIFEFSALNCTDQVAHTARRTQRRCGVAGHETHIEIGFEVGNRFLQIMDVCHDERLESTLYSHYNLTPANAAFQRSFPRPDFEAGDFFNGKDVRNLYTRPVQKETFGRVLGESRIDELFDETREIYLARGHLAAKADYIFGSQQRATFYYVNVAPQWQSFNGGNWVDVESGVRDLMGSRNMVTEVFTGTWGVLELKDVNGTYRPIFLDDSNEGQIPVPMLFYKVLFEPHTRRGIVLIGVNNPHVTEEEIANGKYTICKDYSHLIDWLSWERTNVVRGYSYACNVNEFRRVVPHLPLRIPASGLLV